MDMNNPYVRALGMIVATAAAIRLTWMLLEPALPFLIVLVVLLGTVRIFHWWRNRW